MLDFSFAELFIIVVIAVIVMGPKDIPKIMYGFGRIVRRLQYMRFALSNQFDEFLKQHDMDDLHKNVNFEAPVYDEAAADEDYTQETAVPDNETQDGEGTDHDR